MPRETARHVLQTASAAVTCSQSEACCKRHQLCNRDVFSALYLPCYWASSLGLPRFLEIKQTIDPALNKFRGSPERSGAHKKALGGRTR